MGRNPVFEKKGGVETASCIRNLTMRHFQVKTLVGHEFAFTGRTQGKNMEPKLFPDETNLIYVLVRRP